MWGGMACFAFYAMLVRRAGVDSSLQQAFGGDGAAVKTCASLLFFTGLAQLASRLWRAAIQYGALQRCQAALAIPQSDDARKLLVEIQRESTARRDDYLSGRLTLLAPLVEGSAATESVATDVALLAENDRRTLQAAFAGVSVIQKSLPILGFMGVALGVGAGIRQIAVVSGAPAIAAPGFTMALECIMQTAALTLALIAARMLTERVELRLVGAIDEAFRGHFSSPHSQASSGGGPSSYALMRQCEKLLDSVQTAVSQHDVVMSKAVTSAGRRWEEAAATATALLHRTVGDAIGSGLKEHAEALNAGIGKFTVDLENVLIRHAQILSENIDVHTGGLADALEHHTAVMTQTETNLAAENRRHLSEVEAALGEAMVISSNRQEKLIKQSEDLLRDMRDSLVEAAGTTVAQQQQLVRQSEVLLKVVEATGQIRSLEEALNSNLATLAASHRFEETVVGLSAALQLLSANLGRPASQREEITLHATRSASQAA